jgi:hypothetical protein
MYKGHFEQAENVKKKIFFSFSPPEKSFHRSMTEPRSPQTLPFING